MTSLSILSRALPLEVFFQVALAVLLGGAIGIERELKGKPAGLRTNILICIGATLFTHLSYRLSPPNGDVGRVAAQIVSGIGFLGAGTILHARGTIVGLTSAATIWLVAALGLAVGSRAYMEALGTTVVAMLVLDGLGRLETALEERGYRSQILVRLAPTQGSVEGVEGLLRDSGLRVEGCHVRKEPDGLVLEAELIGSRRLHDAARLLLLQADSVTGISVSRIAPS